MEDAYSGNPDMEIVAGKSLAWEILTWETSTKATLTIFKKALT